MARSRIQGAIPIERMANEITKMMTEYSDDVAEAMRKAVSETSAEAVLDLKRNSPKRKGPKGGAYARSWKYDAIEETRTKWRNVVHNVKHYRLTHLLERGHANARGGGRTPAYPHIGLAEAKAIDNLAEKMRQYINDVD